MSTPSVSIITVARNSTKYIESTLRSVISQTYPDIEYIVIDGASTDGTQDIIEKYRDKLDYFISEHDTGIAEAMNKGAAQAKGDYLLFLNSDDYLLHDNVIEQAATDIAEDRHDVHIFRVRFLYEDGRTINSLIHGLGLLTIFKMGSCHQGQLVSRQRFNDLGGFDTSLRINFDYDLLLRAWRAGARSCSHERVLSVMRQVGISSRRDWQGFMERYREEKVVHFKNCQSWAMRLVYHCYWTLYIPYRFIRYILIAFNRRFIKNKSIRVLQ